MKLSFRNEAQRLAVLERMGELVGISGLVNDGHLTDRGLLLCAMVAFLAVDGAAEFAPQSFLRLSPGLLIQVVGAMDAINSNPAAIDSWLASTDVAAESARTN